MLIKKSLIYSWTTVDTGVDNMTAVRFLHCETDIILISVYIPPLHSSYYLGKDVSCNLWCLEDVILKCQEKYPRSAIVICGDLNSRIGSWDTHVEESEERESNVNRMELMDCICENLRSPRMSQDKTVNDFGKILRRLCKVHHLSVLNGSTDGDKRGSYTYISPHGDSVIDYCLVAAHFLPFKMDLKVGSRVESHHMPIEIELGQLCARDTSDLSEINYTKLIWDPTMENSFLERLMTREFENQIEKANEAIDSSVDTALSFCNQALSWCAESMRKEVRTGRIANKPGSKWFDDDCRSAKRLATKSLRNFKKHGTSKAKATYLEVRNKYKSIIKEKKRSHFTDMRSALLKSYRDSKTFWSLVKKSTWRITQQPKIDIKTWKSHFQNIFQSKDCFEQEHTMGELRHHALLDAEISSEEVRHAVRNLKASKAPGIDGLPGGCLKLAAEKMMPFLTRLFTDIFESHLFPKAWFLSIIVPIHKKGMF